MLNAKNMLPLTTLTADHFFWTGKEGAAEVSSLPEHLISQVYRDACDAGFLCLSPRTGRTVLFTVTENIGRYSGWILKDNEGLGLTIKIFND